MVFKRLFGSGNTPAPQDEPDDDTADDDTADDEGFAGAEAEDPEAADDLSWGERAADVIATGSSTGSKRPDALWGSRDVHAPTHYTHAQGCRVVTADDETLIDCTMALGSVALGYGDEGVTGAVVAAASGGPVAGLPHILEVEVAERFCEVVPCAERVQFLKSGAEAMAAAVRIARTYTGRSRVIGSGYFGWLDWSATAAGVPEGVRNDFVQVPFGDIGALESAVAEAGSHLAAIAIEPVVETMPPVEWIQRARALATQTGAALIFDEVKTGFRLARGGYQELSQKLSGVTPDLAAFGKALANGYPLSAVCGSAALMESTRTTWVSSTLAGEAVALAAARAVLLAHDRDDICAQLAQRGAAMRDAVGNAVRASRLPGIAFAGIDPMWFLTFDSPQLETRFLVAAAASGVLFKRGPYNFASLAHDEDTIHEIERCTSNALVALRDSQ